jgi:HD-GYP domain-containing protein (c-di-GMP phosphodiesterase class II)
LLKEPPVVVDVLSMGTRIISICDVFQAIRAERDYDAPAEPAAQFDLAAVKAFKAQLAAQDALPQAA